MNLNSFFKPDPGSLYPNDVGLFLNDLRNDKGKSWPYLLKRVERISELRYMRLVSSKEVRNNLNVEAMGMFLRDLRHEARNATFGETIADFENLLIKKYLNGAYYGYHYAHNLPELYEALFTKNETAWKIFKEMAFQKVARIRIFRDIGDHDEQQEVLHVATEKFTQSIFGNKFNVDLAERSVASLVGYFVTIASRESANYFRAIKKFRPQNLDELETNDEDDFEDGKVLATDAIGEDMDLMSDKILTYESVDDDEGNTEGKKIGIIKQISIKEWTKQALRDCLDKLGDGDLAKTKGKKINHWREVIEMKVVFGKSHNEIADELNISASYSQNKLAKAIELLRACMISKGVYHSKP